MTAKTESWMKTPGRSSFRGNSLWVFLIFGILLVEPKLVADSVSIYPIADTSLFEYTPSNNLGGGSLVSGTIGLGYRSRALVQFATSDIPTNVYLLAASLILTVSRTPQAGGVASYFDLHRMLRPWGEGNKSDGGPGGGAPADPGEATWIALFSKQSLGRAGRFRTR
jgi:hypothetical protein